MSQGRTRPKVTLTLDPDIRAAADQLRKELPGEMSLSELVDLLLEDFVNTIGPMVKQLVEADPLERVTTMHQLLGQQMFDFAGELARAKEEADTGKE